MDEEIKSPKPPKKKMSRVKKIGIALLIFILIGIICFLIWFFFFRNQVSTDDAYVNGNRVIINAQVSGSCIAYFADANQYVEEGDLLAVIDPTNYRIAFRQSLDELENICRQVKQLEEQVIAMEFDILEQEKVLARAQYDVENRKALVGILAVAKEEVEHNVTAMSSALDHLDSLKAQRMGKLALLGSGPLDEHPWIKAQQESVRNAYADLMRCNIFAPVSGLIALRYIQVGQYVIPSTEMMSVVPYEQMWVDANYKETQLTNLRIGQKATLTFDEFGSQVQFHGTVQGIQMGTGSAFSLLPAQNATGNWIKIVQRIPVRIQLDPEQIRRHPLRIGLSSYVTVDTENRQGPVLQSKGSFCWCQSTNVMSIDFLPVNVVIDEIVKENLYGW